MFNAGGDKSGETLVNQVFLAVNPKFDFGSQIHDIIIVEAVEAHHLSKIMGMLFLKIWIVIDLISAAKVAD